MKKLHINVLFFLFLSFMITSAGHAAGTTNISYTLTFPEAQAHYVDVEMQLSGLKQNSLELKMPVWTPGSYLVREFARNIETISASANGKPVTIQKTRKNIWHINTTGISTITVKYRVYAFEVSVRTSFIDVDHAFLSSADIFIYPNGMLNQPSTIHIIPYKKWDKVSTSLATINDDTFTLTAPNYDILFDSPIEVGNQDVFSFTTGGVKYDVAMCGEANYDKERLKKDMAKIVEEEVAVFGENPNKHYTFIVHNYLKGGGGLEHLSSTVLGASRSAYTDEKKGYQGFLSLVAHEHFHLWNVKRLRPIALGPFDYDNENYTTNLWIAEGFTSYYQDIILRRAQLYPPENYLGTLAENISALENQPGVNIQPVADASYDAWIKAYRPNENSANSTISYYSKGSLIALLLDLEIINNTSGTKSLDDVMRYMYEQYYKIKKRGYTDAEFKLGLEKFAGKNLDDFYKNYINGLTPLDFNKYLGYAGYELKDEYAGSNDPALGIATGVNADKKIVVTAVLRDGAAWKDGLNVGDQLLAMDGKTLTTVKGLLNDKQTGDKVIFTVDRDGLKRDIAVTLLKNTQVKYTIESLPTLSAQQQTVRNKWLKLQ
ncbi:M61 family metallopeptidase [Mucilaginibacter puniceus]